MNKQSISEDKIVSKVFVGLDVHLRSYSVTVIANGEVLKRWTMPAEPVNLSNQLKYLFSEAEINSVYEAGFSGFELHRHLVLNGIRNIVVHAASVAVSKLDRVKTDRRDSEKLARYLSAGMLKGINVPSREEEYQRQLTRTRAQLVKDRVRAMVQIRRRLYHFGYEVCPGKLLSIKAVKEHINMLEDNELKWSIQSHLRLWESLNQEIRFIEQKMLLQAEKCPYEILYRQVPGIGKISSRILANELGDMSRFKNEKALFSYVGLTPTENSSGETVRRGSISRQGNSLIRKILVESAWVAIRKDKQLRAYYHRLAVRTGSKKAIVAVARKLIGKTRAVLRTGESYRESSLELVTTLPN